MVLTLVVSILVFVVLFLSIILFPSFKIKGHKIGTYWIIALVGAVLLLACGCVPIKEVFASLTENNAINPIKILVLFLSMTFLSIFLDEMGVFKWAAEKAVKLAHNKQISIFLSIFAVAAILTTFTSNDIVILTLTPFICFFCKNTKVNPIPYLIGEFVAANTFSMMLIIGNPTNIYLATSQGISFVQYLEIMFAPTMFAGMIELLLVLLIFRKSLKQPIEKVYNHVLIEDKWDTMVGVVHLGICLVFLIISSYVGVEMWLISLLCATSLFIYVFISKLIKKNKDDKLFNTIARLPWELIPFVLSMFVIIIALEHQGVVAKLAEAISHGNTVFVYGTTSFLASNIINNIPMSMLYSHMITVLGEGELTKATYAAIVGSNIGAFLTPIGALAGIMFTSLTEKYNTKLNFKTFVLYGSIISIPVLLVSLGTLALIFL